MSKMNIRFRDPSTGQTHSVEANVVDKIARDNPQSVDQLRNNVADGKIDVFAHAESESTGWYNNSVGNTYHLQIDTNALSSEQVKALAAAIESGADDAVSVQGTSRYGNRGFTATTIQTDLWNERAGDLGVGEHDPSVPLAGSRQNPVTLTENGTFAVETQSTGLRAEVEGIYAAAEAIDTLGEGETLFAKNGVSLETQERTLTSLADTANQLLHSDLTPQEQTQARSSIATVLTDMLGQLPKEGPGSELQAAAFEQLQGIIQNETHTALKESMIFNAVRVQSGLNEEMAATVDQFRAEIAPTKPPYDQWFKDGKNEVNISFAAGHGEGFYEGMTEFLSARGFEVVDEGSQSYRNERPRHLQLKRQVNGEERTVNLYLRDFEHDTFKDIDNDDMDIIAYGGHSNLGTNTRKSVDNAPDATGDGKLIFLGLCSGKDNLDRVRKAFPDAQLMTTFNSSYFSKSNGQFSTGEDAKTLMQIIDGVVREADWSEINDNIREHAVGYNHDNKTLGNYLSPIELKMGARLRDLDNDGSAMALDRHFNVDTLSVDASRHNQFAPRDNNAEGQKLNGALPHLAAVFANTVDLYNPTYDNFSHESRIVSDGFFQGTNNDPIVKFETRTEGGEKVFTMQVNDKYAHMGEEALRAVTMVEYNRHLANTESSYPINDPVKRELVGILTAAASLTYDSGYNDASTFKGIVEHYGLPSDLTWRDAGGLIDKAKHDYTGSVSMVNDWLEKLDPATVEALKEKFSQ